MISNIKERWKAFCDWQQRPYQLSPMSEEHHRCFTCGQEYQGNFCPHCGQSARIGRYSLRNALLLFLDVWGVGNRGMFRTLRDLLLRPGLLWADSALAADRSAVFLLPQESRHPRLAILRTPRSLGIYIQPD
jgi:hypothetical protein